MSETEFLVDAVDYLVALLRRGLSGQLEYRECDTIKKWFQTLPTRIDRLHSL